LTWSHAEYVTTFLAYLDKLSTLERCPTCDRPSYRRERRRELARKLTSGVAKTRVIHPRPLEAAAPATS
jgi:hypothetical protein